MFRDGAVTPPMDARAEGKIRPFSTIREYQYWLYHCSCGKPYVNEDKCIYCGKEKTQPNKDRLACMLGLNLNSNRRSVNHNGHDPNK